MRTRTLLVAAFGVILALVVGRAYWSYRSFDETLAEYSALVARHNRIDAGIRRAAAIAIDMETGVRGWLVTGDASFLEPYHRASSERAAAFAELADAVRGDAELERLAGTAANQLEAWEHDIARTLLAPDMPTRPISERAPIHREGKTRMDAIRATIDRLHEGLAARRAAESSALAGYQRQLAISASAVSGLIAIVLIAAALATLRAIEQPLAKLVAHADRVAEGQAGEIDVGGAQEIQTLSAAMSRMGAKIADERERERAFTELVAALASGGDVRTIAGVALRSLGAMVDANGGVLWLVAESDAALELGASFGLDPKSLPIEGDPLAIEIRASGRASRVDELSRRSSHVLRSAIVDIVPRSLLVSPVRAGSSIVGVIELAGSLPSDAQERLDRGLARVGLALQNSIAASRTEALRDRLANVNEELQAQNEELKAQEEELRAQSEELVAKQSELAQRNEELLRASRLKSDFLSNMSHELRTPLNAIIGFSDVLLAGGQGELRDGQRDAVTHVHDAGRQLLTLVNDILDLSKIEAGHLDLRLQNVDVADPVQQACSLLRSMATGRRVRIDDRTTRGALFCRADADRLRQVLVNLLSNAVKFTPEGGTVTLSARGEAGAVRIEVADTGIGIAPSDVARLFQPFTQVSAAPSGGTGLGLSICKRLVEAMAGHIGLTSDLGKGSTFFFTLPPGDAASTPSVAPASTHSHAKAGTRRALIVEDRPGDARVTATILARGGYDAAIESTAESALAELEKAPPHLLVVDLGLPGISGLALIRRVRATPSLAAVPIVVLTARDLTADEQRDLAASVDLVAQKGVMTESGFLDSLSALPIRSTRQAVARRVLVIDDTEPNRRVARSMLEPAGYAIVEAADAAHGMELARAEQPDVVLMDIRMPGIDGLEATKQLRADPKTAHIPIIAVSAQAMVGDRERAIAAGCVAYLAKPVARRELLHEVEQAIARARARARDAT